MTDAPDPGLTDLIAAHAVVDMALDGGGVQCKCQPRPMDGTCMWSPEDQAAHVALVVGQHTNGREALFDTAELVAAYDRGWNAAEHWWHDGAVEGEIPPNPYIIRAALEGEQQ